MNNPTARASSTTAPTTSKRRTLGFFKPFGGSSRKISSWGTGLTFAAFSSPTSISTLIRLPRSLGVNPFHLPNGASQIGASLVEAIERGDLVVIGASQGILRLNNFNVVGHASIEAVARLVHLFSRKLYAKVGDANLIARGIEIDQGG